MREAAHQPAQRDGHSTDAKRGKGFAGAGHAGAAFLELQHALGNRGVQRLQAKLAIGRRGDKYEQEADRVADQVMRMPAPQVSRTCSCGGACPECQAEQEAMAPEAVQRKPLASGEGGGATVPARAVIPASPGHPLDRATHDFFAARFGQDFSAVRLHTDTQAAEAATTLHARAYTVGQDIVFGPHEYAAGSPRSLRLLAHELTHVVQQTGGSASRAPMVQRDETGASSGEDPCEPSKIWGTWDAMKEILCATGCSLNPWAADDCKMECSNKYGIWAAMRECREKHPLPPLPDPWDTAE